ncbi:MAG: radical SAM protein [Myxococcales bacterium]|nr:radical SAM protein [Myxococcales bacterium]
MRRTTTTCRQCGATVDAAIFQRDGQLFFRSTCAACGSREAPYPEDAGFFDRVLKIVGPHDGSSRRRFYRHGEKLPPLRGVLLDVTGRCNLHCPHCFASANDTLIPEPDLPTLTAWFDTLARSTSGKLPVVFLQGGEPTLREDLPAIVRLLRERGYRLKLVSNGLRLGDAAYVRELKAAGLEWVFLQFDGFSREAYRRLRGLDLLDEKQRALENLVQNEMKILLACMVLSGVNEDQIGPVMDLAIRTPRIQQVSFLPASRLGREPENAGLAATTAFAVMRELARWSGGRLTPDDFLAFMNISKRLWQTTKNADYQPKTCFYPMALALAERDFMPLNRLLSPRALPLAWRHRRALGAMLRHVGNLDDMPYNPHLLTMVIEHFRDPDVFDFADALHCNKFYITADGLGPSCVYNALERDREATAISAAGCQGAG